MNDLFFFLILLILLLLPRSGMFEHIKWILKNKNKNKTQQNHVHVHVHVHFLFQQITHFLPVFAGFPNGPLPSFDNGDSPLSVGLLTRQDLTMSAKIRSTLSAVLAEVSRKSHPKDRALSAPSCFVTSRSCSLSHWLPTSMKIGFSVRLTRNMDWRNTSRRVKEAREAIE